MSIADVIGWKFNHQEGMRCKEIDGVMTIIELPGGLPSQSVQAGWTAEYEAYIAAGGDKDDKATEMLSDPTISAIIDELALLPGGVGLKNKVQARLKGKL